MKVILNSRASMVALHCDGRIESAALFLILNTMRKVDLMKPVHMSTIRDGRNGVAHLNNQSIDRLGI